MTLQDKGERNLKIAKILDSQEFLEISKFPKEHLCSVIINRLYYGVYLIGKSKLLAKDGDTKEEDFLGHGTESAIKEIRNNDEAKQCSYLWVKLKGFYGGKQIHRICLDAVKLRETRNFYDYCSDVEQDKALQDLEGCKKQAESLAKRLKELQ